LKPRGEKRKGYYCKKDLILNTERVGGKIGEKRRRTVRCRMQQGVSCKSKEGGEEVQGMGFSKKGEREERS